MLFPICHLDSELVCVQVWKVTALKHFTIFYISDAYERLDHRESEFWFVSFRILLLPTQSNLEHMLVVYYISVDTTPLCVTVTVRDRRLTVQHTQLETRRHIGCDFIQVQIVYVTSTDESFHGWLVTYYTNAPCVRSCVKWSRSLTECVRLREVPTVVVWLRNFWQSSRTWKFVVYESWSRREVRPSVIIKSG